MLQHRIRLVYRHNNKALFQLPFAPELGLRLQFQNVRCHHILCRESRIRISKKYVPKNDNFYFYLAQTARQTTTIPIF